MMIDAALSYQQAFLHLDLSDQNYNHCPTKEEWSRLETINKFLMVFYDITCIFSGTNYATSNLYFPLVFTALLELRNGLISDEEYIRTMATRMFTKFDKYWSDFNMVLAIAVILDPRYKIEFVEWCYGKVYGKEGPGETSKVRNKLTSLFNEYSNQGDGSYSSASCSSGAGSSNSSFDIGGFRHPQGSYNSITRSVLTEFNNSNEVARPQKSQLELYLEDPRIDTNSNLDVLEYWKANQYRYPEVASMAKDIFAIPISSVASENAFSVGGRVLDQYRSCLKPEIVQALICTRDWLYGDVKEVDQHTAVEELATDILADGLANENAIVINP